jgi:hypothetical protein
VATQQRNRNSKPTKTWRARVKVNCEEYYLGSFKTKEEAVEVENLFREEMVKVFGPPSQRGYNATEYRRERSIFGKRNQ